MPSAPAAAPFTRLSAGVFARSAPAVGPAEQAATSPPEPVGLPALVALVAPAAPAVPVEPPPLVEGDEVRLVVLDEVHAGLVAEAQGYAARIRSLRRWQTAPRPDGERFDQLELAGAWRISQVSATTWLDDAERFVTCLPQTLAALEAGTVLLHQAKAVLWRTRHCAPEVARLVDTRLAPVLGDLCPADVRKRTDRAVLIAEAELLDPDLTAQRHADAVADRRPFVRAGVDGMGTAGAVLPAAQLIGFQQGLDQLERLERAADRDAGVERTTDQRRADLFAALPAMVLAGLAQDAATPAGAPRQPWTLGPEQLAAQVVLNVHVPVATVLGLSEEPGTLDRFGPLSAQHVRLVRPHSLRRVLVDHTTGRPVAVDARTIQLTPPDDDEPDHAQQALRRQARELLVPTVLIDRDEPQHDPSAGLARLIDLRDVHCAGPGCSSTCCDRDHLVPYPQGKTSASNLGLLSPRCHRAKHHGWTLVRHPDGSTTWTSPLHRTYHRPGPHHPPPAVDLSAQPPRPTPAPRGRPAVSAPDAPLVWPTPPPAPTPPDPDAEPPF